MRIVVDAMGSDFHPKPDVEGAVQAARELGVAIVLVGDQNKIQPLLATLDTSGLQIDVVHADEVLTMEDKGMALVLKAKRANARNSMAIGIDLVKRGEAQAFVTMGNTGAASVTAYFRLGTIPGVDRPALAPVEKILVGGHAHGVVDDPEPQDERDKDREPETDPPGRTKDAAEDPAQNPLQKAKSGLGLLPLPARSGHAL